MLRHRVAVPRKRPRVRARVMGLVCRHPLPLRANNDTKTAHPDATLLPKVFHALGQWGPNGTVASMTFLAAGRSEQSDESQGACEGGVFWGSVNVGLIFSEHTNLSAADTGFLSYFDVRDHPSHRH